MYILSSRNQPSGYGRGGKGERCPDDLVTLIQERDKDRWTDLKIEDHIENTRKAIVDLIETLYEAGILKQEHIQVYLRKLGYYNIEIERIS